MARGRRAASGAMPDVSPTRRRSSKPCARYARPRAQPGLGVKPLVARLRAEQPGLGAEARLVREALGALERDKAGLLQNAAACRSKAQAIEVGERRPSPLSTPPNARCCEPSLTAQKEKLQKPCPNHLPRPLRAPPS